MPRLAEPRLPTTVERAVRMLGMNRARVAIALALAKQPLTTPEIVRAVALPANTVGAHLRDMEAEGAVTASPAPSEQRRGVPITWALNNQALVDELESVINQLR